MPRPTINWSIIPKALDFYEKLGYSYVEVPWIVSGEAINVTLPPDRTGLRTQDGPLVGSAEQSFLHMALNGDLLSGRHVACSPCFRDDEEDDLHQRYFFKVELILLSLVPILDANRRVRDMADEALVFFTGLYGGRDASIVPTEQGLDIEVNGIEVGSYGYRSYKELHWIFGTGIAEPRFSLASSGRFRR